MQEKAVESIKSQYVHQRRLLPALALDLLETTPCLLSLEDCPSMAHEKIHLALFTLFMIATASLMRPTLVLWNLLCTHSH